MNIEIIFKEILLHPNLEKVGGVRAQGEYRCGGGRGGGTSVCLELPGGGGRHW